MVRERAGAPGPRTDQHRGASKKARRARGQARARGHQTLRRAQRKARGKPLLACTAMGPRTLGGVRIVWDVAGSGAMLSSPQFRGNRTTASLRGEQAGAASG